MSRTATRALTGAGLVVVGFLLSVALARTAFSLLQPRSSASFASRILNIFGYPPKDAGGDEDRPPIMVGDGSVIFDSGDSNADPSTWKDWTPAKTSGHYKPDHLNGAPVDSFAVTISGADSSQCASTFMEGDFITIDFSSDDNTQTWHLYVMRAREGGASSKWVPDVAPPANGSFTQVIKQNGAKAPGRLVYGTSGSGWISNVHVDAGSCAFIQPKTPADRSQVQIKIQPEK